MNFRQIYDHVGRFTFLSESKALELYDFVVRNKPRQIFELGCYRGGSALIMAAALQKNGGGRVTTFDCHAIRALKPNVETLIDKTGLRRYVSVVYCDWCFEWELGKLLERNLKSGRYRPYVDFVFLDGGHYWTVTGFAFELVTKLLKPGGWILFDDLDWVIASDEEPGTEYVSALSPEATCRPMVRMVFDLLVKPDRSYESCRVSEDGRWGWARRRRSRRMRRRPLDPP